MIPEHEEEDERVVTALAASSQSTIARINYRFSPQYCWPTPLHDVLHGYDWISENMLLPRNPLSRLGVCGELAGGSLATALALTECRVGGSGIVAAAVNNPIADWVFPDDFPVNEPENLPEPQAPEETAFPADGDMMTWWAEQEEKEPEKKPAKGSKRTKKKPKGPPPTSWTANADNPIVPTVSLSGERDVLFEKPEHLFDRFASPIHFFRSPHGHLIYPQSDDIQASSPSDVPQDPLDLEAQMYLNHYESEARETPDSGPETPVLSRCRAYARIYPPATALLSLPQFHITSGSQSPLLDQASELARMLRRSMARQALRSKTARVMWKDPTEKKKFEDWADQRVHFDTTEGVGLWSISDSPEQTARIEKIGQWMNRSLTTDSK